jgi:glycerophosphoryl diester phosphodiesterase
MAARVVRVVASRGDCAGAPENTLPAFAAAVKAGADELHADVRITKDGVPVLCRDASCGRTTGKDVLLRELTLAEAKELDAGAQFAGRKAHVHIPTLEAFIGGYLAKLPAQLQLEETGSVLPTVALLQGLVEQGAFDRILAVSTDRAILSSLRMLDSRVRLAQLLERRSPVTLADVKLFGANAVVSFWEDAAERGYADDARKLGLTVYAWGAERVEDALLAAAAGVDGILYERPGELLPKLTEAGHRENGSPSSCPAGKATNGKTAARTQSA